MGSPVRPEPESRVQRILGRYGATRTVLPGGGGDRVDRLTRGLAMFRDRDEAQRQAYEAAYMEELRRQAGPQDPAETRRILGQQVKETFVQPVRGLAESGYATAMGVTNLLGAGGATESLQNQRQEMREFYGDPQTGVGQVAQTVGEMAGTAAQFMVPGAGATRAGLISRGAPIVTQVAANVALGVPLDMIQGASERERSIAGLLADQANIQALDGVAESPFKRALFEGLAGGALSVVGDLPTVLRGFKNPWRARFVEVSAEDFNRALQNFSRVKPDYQGFITWRTADEMRSEGMKMYLTPDGRAGYALAPDGDMRNLFTTPGAPGGTGAYAVAHAISEGGTKLDAFDTKLTDIYKDMGALETWRMQWDDAHRPQGWREDMFGRPDVVGMEVPERLRGRSADELMDLYNERRVARGKPAYERPPEGFMGKVRAIFGDERGMTGAGIPAEETWAKLRDTRRNLLMTDERAFAENRAANMARIAQVFDELPDVKEIGAAAMAGQVKRGWYRRSSQALVDTFGPDAPRFAAALAALSPQTSVEQNLENTLRVWNGWNRAGRPKDRKSIVDLVRTNISADSEAMTSWVNNLQRALIEDDPVAYTLSGPKVDSFMRNLVDDVNSVTLDTWMANFAGVEQQFLRGRQTGRDVYGTHKGKSANYIGYSAKVRDTAEYLSDLTGSAWTPEEVQETVWSWAKALQEKGKFDIGSVTDEMIDSVPDFSGLLGQPRYRSLLEQGGLYAPRPSAGAAPTNLGAGLLNEERLRAAAMRMEGGR